MYNRIGRRTRRTSEEKIVQSRLRDRRVADADEEEAEAKIGEMNLTPEEVQGLLELLPYKEALIKIAKGEFEIERVEEAEEEESEEAPAEEAEAEGEDTEKAEAEEFEEDEDYAEGEDDEEDYYDEEDETEAVEDSAITDAWKKRLSGNKN